MSKTTVNMDNLSKDALAGLVVDQVADIKKAKVKEILDAVFGTREEPGIIASALRRNSKVSLPGFGIFKPFVRAATKARKGIRPGTNETMMFAAKPAQKIVKFRVGTVLKEHVAKK